MLGPRMTRLAAVPALTAMVLSAACGGDEDDSSAPSEHEDDARAAVVEERWDAYWQARIASENSGELHHAAFADVASGRALEAQTRRLRNYERKGLVRHGTPELRDAEIRLSDDSATVLACLDADGWTALVDGEPWSATKYGWELTGSIMRQIEGTWVVVDELATGDVRDMGKTC